MQIGAPDLKDLRILFWYFFYTGNNHVLTVIVNGYFPERRGFPVCRGWCSYWGLSAGSTKMLLKRDNQEICHWKLNCHWYSSWLYAAVSNFFFWMNKNHQSPVSMKLHKFPSVVLKCKNVNLWGPKYKHLWECIYLHWLSSHLFYMKVINCDIWH